MTNAICLHKSEWNHRISHLARLDIDKAHFQKVDVLPISRDVAKVSRHLKEELKKCIEEYEQGKGNHSNSKKVLAMMIIFFNKRRGGEFIRITCADMQLAVARPNQEIGDAQAALSTFEVELTKRMRCLRITGKQGRGVPVILGDLEMTLLGELMKDQNCSGDKYTFQSSRNLPYQSHVLFNNLTKQLTLECPTAIRATAMRKYCATAIQIMDLHDHEKKWILEHLGHTLATHDHHYRLSMDSAETAKVAKLMFMVDAGQTHRVQGKSLQDIDQFLEHDEIFGDVTTSDYIHNTEEEHDANGLSRLVFY